MIRGRFLDRYDMYDSIVPAQSALHEDAVDGAPDTDVGEREKDAPLLRIIVATVGTTGDIAPFIVLAQTLMARGHRVLMLAPALHASAVQTAGLPYRAVGTCEEMQSALENPDLWHERKGWEVIWRSALPHLGAIRQAIQEVPERQPCAVLSHPLLAPAASLARSARPDLRIAVAYLAPSNLFSVHDATSLGSLTIPAWVPLKVRRALWRAVHSWLNARTLPGLNAKRAHCRLPAVADFVEHMLQTPDVSLGLFPEWFARAQVDWPRPYVAAGTIFSDARAVMMPPDLERFLDAGEPPIVFTAGTGNLHAARFFKIALQTLGEIERRGIFVTNHRDQIPCPLPPHVMWLAHAPFSMLLRRAAAIVHHGGIGTTAEAMRAGIAQLIVPHAFDQFDNAHRARRCAGASIVLAKRLSVRRLRSALTRLLTSPTVALACREAEQRMASAPALETVIDRVEAALRREG